MSRLCPIGVALWFVAATELAGCDGAPRPVSETVLPIVGGSLATTCVWPTAIMTGGPLECSATLVHPRLVVTAKHCLVNSKGVLQIPDWIALGESSLDWVRTVGIAQCLVHPTNDIGFCTLTEDVADIPIVPVMAPCETSELQPGRPIVEVGFGVTSPFGQNYGTKKWIDGTIENLSTDQLNINVTTGNQDGEYFGDSGGPLFFRMPDRSWRLIGEDCCSPSIVLGSTAPRISTYTSVPVHVAWMEQQSGIDLTPCHDGNGWNPTAACTGFPTNPETGVGAWDTMCQGESLLRQPTCWGTVSDAASDGGRLDAQDGGRDTANAAIDASLVDADMSDADSEDSVPDLRLLAEAATDQGGAEGAAVYLDTAGLSPEVLDSSLAGSGEEGGGPGISDGNRQDGNVEARGGAQIGEDVGEDSRPSSGPDSEGGKDSPLDTGHGGENDSGIDVAGKAAADGAVTPTDGSVDVARVSRDGASRPDLNREGTLEPLGRSGGCACRSNSDRDSGSGLFWLAIGYLIHRRTRSSPRRPFVV